MKHSRRPFPVLQCCRCVNVSLFQFRDRTRRGLRRGSWGTQDGTAGRRSCLNAVFRALYVAEENYEVRTRKTHTGLGGNAILRFSSGKLGLYQICPLLGALDWIRPAENPVVYRAPGLITPQCLLPRTIVEALRPEAEYAAQIKTNVPHNRLANDGAGELLLFRLAKVEVKLHNEKQEPQ